MAQERDYTDVLTDLDYGKVHQAATAKLREVAKAVMDTGRTGDVVIKLTLKREGNKTLSITPDVKGKVPQASMERSLFYPSAKGDLHQEDPEQQQLKHVPMKPPTPLRTTAEAGEEK